MVAVGLLAVAFLLVTVFLTGRQRRATTLKAKGQLPQTAARIRCIPEYYSDGTLSTNPSFWVTNQTSRTISVTLETFLVPDGTNWIPGLPKFMRTGLMFQTPRGRTVDLLPYEAAHGDSAAGSLALPVGRSFRVQACISEKLTGMKGITAKVKGSPKIAKLRLTSGNTNIPYHAFQKSGSLFSSFDIAVTPEILITHAPVPPPRSPPTLTQRAPQERATAEDIAKARAALREAMTDSAPTSQ
jgi:hypothetical protein